MAKREMCILRDCWKVARWKVPAGWANSRKSFIYLCGEHKRAARPTVVKRV